MFTTCEGDRFYVEPYVGERIREARIQVGEPFTITKTETRTGNVRTVELIVRRIETAPVPAEAAPTVQKQTQQQHTPTPPPVQIPTPPPEALWRQTPPPVPMNGQGATAAEIMADCYRTAVDVALTTQAYAHENGLNIAPVFEDIRTMGTALYISTQGRRP